MTLTTYIVDAKDRKGRQKSKLIMDSIECPEISTVYGERDFLSGHNHLDNRRDAVFHSNVVVAVVTDSFLTDPDCLYDVAIAISIDRPVVLIDFTKKEKIPFMLHKLMRVNARKGFPRLIRKLKTLLDVLHVDSSTEDFISLEQRTKEDALIHIRMIERSESLDIEHSLHKRCSELSKELDNARVARFINIRIESAELSDIVEERRKRYETEWQLKKAKDEIRRKQRQLMEIKQLHKIPIESQETSSDENQFPTDVNDETLQAIHDHLSLIYIRIAQLDTNSPGRQTIPTELKSFFKKYEKMIGPRIRQFGHKLNLSLEELDKVMELKAFGYEAMFWETIKFWHPKVRQQQGTFNIFLDALEEIGVNIGGKPMSKAEVNFLHEKIPFLQKNLYKVTDLIPHLLSSHVLTDDTRMYVCQANDDVCRLLRLVDVLTTKSFGIKALCDALYETDQHFIAEEIYGTMSATPSTSCQRECTDASSDSFSSSDEPTIKVALVEPVVRKAQRCREPSEHLEKVHISEIDTSSNNLSVQES